MRAWMAATIVATAFLASGCNDKCSGNSSQSGTLNQAAPMSQLMVTIDHCSTCAHATAQVLWSGPTAGVTGTIDLKVYPGCFVQPIVDSRAATAGVGDYKDDFNVANCGDDISYTGVATNNSNVTMTEMQLFIDCTPFKAPATM